MPTIGFAFEIDRKIRRKFSCRKFLELGRTVMFSIRLSRCTIAALAFTALAVPGSLSAQTPDHPADNSAQFPTSHDLKSLTMSGSYLAARHASVERDASSAATFYRSALRTDPKNNELLDRAFISSLADGDIDEAVKLADIPRGFGAHAVDGAHEIAVGHGVRGQLQFPQILAEAGHGGRWVEDDLGAGQPQGARAFREVAVVTDVNADLGEAQVEHVAPAA